MGKIWFEQRQQLAPSKKTKEIKVVEIGFLLLLSSSPLRLEGADTLKCRCVSRSLCRKVNDYGHTQKCDFFVLDPK